MVNEALAVQRARCVCAGGAFFTSPRLRGEVASILRAGEGESQAGPDSRMVPLTPILRCASSRTSPRQPGEVALDPVIASGAKQSISQRSKCRLLRRFASRNVDSEDECCMTVMHGRPPVG